MAKRLVLGLVIVAGLVTVALWPQPPVAAFWERGPVPTRAQKAAEPDANSRPQFGPVGAETALVEEFVIEANGVVRSVQAVVEVKSLRERYLEYHRRIAEKLTAEQLAEKCNSLRKEAAEVEIEQIQKQLDQLKRSTVGDKGISTRVQDAIEALKKKPTEDFNSL